ncbi:MAG: proprotein convertase P-domain-containing protein [Myxococcales bacterium]|nr:proprotein convertase P-domain-containing protein [Myxococcales bacterium]
MKRTLLGGLGLGLLSSLALAPLGAGCTASSGDSLHLPGDIDDADDVGGKGDAWDYGNDPRRLSQHLDYHLDAIPRSGKLDKPVWAARTTPRTDDDPLWADTYWPTVEGSTNARWQGHAIKSPLEKYDTAFNGAAGCEQPAQRCGDTAKADWDQYMACAGPAAKWHTANFQGSRRMYDGVDNDGDGQVDECGDHDGIAGWWGLCHSWSPAAILEPEPKHAVVYNGETFEVGDIKALIITLYDKTDAVMLGGRCNTNDFTRDANGDYSNIPAECQDVNPGALHVILGNFLGINDQALVEDRTADDEVWNQPVQGYDVLKQDLVDGKRANACIGDSGETYTRNAAAKDLYEVKMRVHYLFEGYASTEPVGMQGHLGTDDYHYILEVSSDGKIVGGTYCTDSIGHHPDFLWAPTGVSSSSYGRNPSVALDKVRTLINLSREDDHGGGGTTEGRSYEATGTAAIPDNDPAGAILALDVPDTFTFTGVSATVDITHTWRGDLVVELLKDGATVKVLSDKAGGSADDLEETFTLSAADVGTSAAAGTWALKVTDTAAQDTGTINSFKLTFTE